MNSNNHSFTAEELEQISGKDDLKISPLRADGVNYGTPTWIWNVAVNGQLYVRAYNGQNSRWYQSAIQQQKGRIHAAGMVREVVFEAVSDDINEKIDAAYKIKYAKSPYLPDMVSRRAKIATVRITPGSIK